MKRCESCKFWINLDGVEIMPIGRCSKAIQFWDATKWSDEGDIYQKILKPEHANSLLFVLDNINYNAKLLTKPNFGCVLHEENN